MTNIAYAALLLFIFTIPWEQLILIPGLGTGSRLMGALAFPLCLIAIVRNGRISFPWPIGLLAAFVVLVALSLSWTPQIEGGLSATQTYVQLFLMTWLVVQMIDSETKLHGVFMTYILGSCIAALKGIQAYTLGAGYARFSAEGMDPNDLALDLAIAIAMAGYLVVCRRGWWRLVALGFIPLGLYAILLSASRAGFLAALIVAPLPILLTLRPRRYARALAIGAVALVVASVLLVRYVPASSWNRIATIDSEVSEGGLSGRVAIWSVGLDIINEAPILGVGVAGYSTAMQRLAGWSHAPHNGFLAIAAQFGVVGLLIVLTAWALVIRDVLAMPVLERRTWIAILAVLLLAVSSINWEWHKTSWMILGLALAHARYSQSRPSWTAELAPDLVSTRDGRSIRAVHRG